MNELNNPNTHCKNLELESSACIQYGAFDLQVFAVKEGDNWEIQDWQLSGKHIQDKALIKAVNERIYEPEIFAELIKRFEIYSKKRG